MRGIHLRMPDLMAVGSLTALVSMGRMIHGARAMSFSAESRCCGLRPFPDWSASWASLATRCGAPDLPVPISIPATDTVALLGFKTAGAAAAKTKYTRLAV